MQHPVTHALRLLAKRQSGTPHVPWQAVGLKGKERGGGALSFVFQQPFCLFHQLLPRHFRSGVGGGGGSQHTRPCLASQQQSRCAPLVMQTFLSGPLPHDRFPDKRIGTAVSKVTGLLAVNSGSKCCPGRLVGWSACRSTAPATQPLPLPPPPPSGSWPRHRWGQRRSTCPRLQPRASAGNVLSWA
jgi:hypothetical protein